MFLLSYHIISFLDTLVLILFGENNTINHIWLLIQMLSISNIQLLNNNDNAKDPTFTKHPISNLYLILLNMGMNNYLVKLICHICSIPFIISSAIILYGLYKTLLRSCIIYLLDL